MEVDFVFPLQISLALLVEMQHLTLLCLPVKALHFFFKYIFCALCAHYKEKVLKMR